MSHDNTLPNEYDSMLSDSFKSSSISVLRSDMHKDDAHNMTLEGSVISRATTLPLLEKNIQKALGYKDRLVAFQPQTCNMSKDAWTVGLMKGFFWPVERGYGRMNARFQVKSPLVGQENVHYRFINEPNDSNMIKAGEFNAFDVVSIDSRGQDIGNHYRFVVFRKTHIDETPVVLASEGSSSVKMRSHEYNHTDTISEGVKILKHTQQKLVDEIQTLNDECALSRNVHKKQIIEIQNKLDEELKKNGMYKKKFDHIRVQFQDSRRISSAKTKEQMKVLQDELYRCVKHNKSLQDKLCRCVEDNMALREKLYCVENEEVIQDKLYRCFEHNKLLGMHAEEYARKLDNDRRNNEGNHQPSIDTHNRLFVAEEAVRNHNMHVEIDRLLSYILDKGSCRE